MRNPSKILALGLFLGLSLGFAGCTESSWEGVEFAASQEVKKLPTEVQFQIQTMLKNQFGTPANPKAPKSTDLDQARLEAGSEVYRINCMHCHGSSGNGLGPTAPFLFPRPRDYRQGVFKFTSTSGTAKPTMEDLQSIIQEGVNYTTMPSFALYGDKFIADVAEYVKFLSIRGEVERLLVTIYEEDDEIEEDAEEEWTEFVAESWNEAEEAVIKPLTDRIEYTEASIKRGRELFLSKGAQCVSCHGEDGRGDTPQRLTDSWKNETQAADLTRGIYRGGGRPIDLYRRIYVGIKGSPMPGFGGKLDPEDSKKDSDMVWDLVNFVYSLDQGQG